MHAARGRGARFHHFRSEGTVPGSFKAVDKAVRLIVKFWLMPHMRRRRPPTAKRETKSQEPRSNVVSNEQRDRTYPSGSGLYRVLNVIPVCNSFYVNDARHIRVRLLMTF